VEDAHKAIDSGRNMRQLSDATAHEKRNEDGRNPIRNVFCFHG
jgi:hypothetical protein